MTIHTLQNPSDSSDVQCVYRLRTSGNMSFRYKILLLLGTFSVWCVFLFVFRHHVTGYLALSSAALLFACLIRRRLVRLRYGVCFAFDDVVERDASLDSAVFCVQGLYFVGGLLSVRCLLNPTHNHSTACTYVLLYLGLRETSIDSVLVWNLVIVSSIGGLDQDEFHRCPCLGVHGGGVHRCVRGVALSPRRSWLVVAISTVTHVPPWDNQDARKL